MCNVVNVIYPNSLLIALVLLRLTYVCLDVYRQAVSVRTRMALLRT